MKSLGLSIYLWLVLLNSAALLSTAIAADKESKTIEASKTTPVIAKDKSSKDEKKKDSEWEKFYEKELAKLNFEKAKLEHQKEVLELEYAILEAQDQKMLAATEAKRRHLMLENELTEQLVRKEQLRIELRKVRNDYLLDPFQDGQLYISDRRISLNGPIHADIADEITHYIHYYNNKNSKYPIFLVIDRCPGGSVMEGARIVEAMRNSKAPVYVVVKSAAISMGAVITALAERSFAYPNALILHHQMSGWYYGNNTQVSERLKVAEEWSERLMTPIAQKMGFSLEEFVNAMYEHNTEGNWLEFANNAQKLGWVDHVVSSIHETSYIDAPLTEEEEAVSEGGTVVLKAGVPEINAMVKGGAQLKLYLPPLNPGDFYHLYDPQGIYKIAIP